MIGEERTITGSRASRATNPAPDASRCTVSVVIPCYEVVAHIDECVESVLCQSHVDLEIVLVDDGSTDGTAARLAYWATVGDRVQVVQHDVNRGLGAARNSGVDSSVGDYIFFLDADDLLPSDALERMVGSATSSGADLVSGVVMRFDSAGEARAAQYRSPFDHDRVGTHIFDEPQLVHDQMACSKLYRRSSWERTGLRFPEGVLYEDIDLVMRAHCSARSVDLISSPTYRWRRRESGAPSITQDRFRPGSVSARFAALASADAYLRDHATARVWEEHGMKIMTVDVRLYSRLLSQGGDRFADEFIPGARELVASMSPSAVGRLSPAMREVRAALLEGDTGLVVDCTRFYSGDTSRGPLAMTGAAIGMVRRYPRSFGRILVGEARRAAAAMASRLASIARRLVPTPC